MLSLNYYLVTLDELAGNSVFKRMVILLLMFYTLFEILYLNSNTCKRDGETKSYKAAALPLFIVSTIIL